MLSGKTRKTAAPPAPQRIDPTAVTQSEKYPPLRLPDGTLNRFHFQARLKEVNIWQGECLQTDRKALGGYEALKSGILTEAEMLGLDKESIFDQRSNEDRLMEMLGSMLDTRGEAILEHTEALIDVFEQRMKECVNRHHAPLDAEKYGIIMEAVDRRQKRKEALGKRWLSLIDRVRRLRRITRERVPKPQSRLPGHWTHEFDDAYEASWPWRVAIYLYRSDIAADNREKEPSAADRVLEISDHHAKMAIDLWKSRYGITIYAAGTEEENHSDPVFWQIYRLDKLTWTKKGDYICRGIVLICPPRHGKSTLGQAWMVTELIVNPRLQSIMLHAVEDKAEENFRHVKAAFDEKTSIGRRCVSLFGLRVHQKDDNKNDRMRLINRERTRDPQIRARGVKSSVGGSNADIQWWDDPVNPEEANQAEVREATYRKLTQQFMQRRQGSKSFLVITATVWHMDDAVWRLKMEADRRHIQFANSVQRVGGPHTTPPFKPLWPSKYPAAELRRIFNEMKDPVGWSHQYMVDPQPAERRIIKKVALYDRESEAHKEFMVGAECHLSLDPSATSRANAKKHTDKAALVYAGCGSVFDREEMSDRVVCRILAAEQFNAGPTEAVEKVGEYSKRTRVDKVHVEVVGFATSIVEMLKNRYQLTSSQVVIHNAHAGKSKEIRLRAVAPMLDDSAREHGLPSAVVEFPGVWTVDGETKKLVPDPEIEWLIEEIVNFGMVATDNGLDATTQLLKHLQGDLAPGEGAVTRSVIGSESLDPVNVQRRKLLQSYRDDEEEKGKDVWEEELGFLTGVTREDQWPN